MGERGKAAWARELIAAVRSGLVGFHWQRLRERVLPSLLGRSLDPQTYASFKMIPLLDCLIKLAVVTVAANPACRPLLLQRFQRVRDSSIPPAIAFPLRRTCVSINTIEVNKSNAWGMSIRGCVLRSFHLMLAICLVALPRRL